MDDNLYDEFGNYIGPDISDHEDMSDLEDEASLDQQEDIDQGSMEMEGMCSLLEIGNSI